MEYHRYTTPAIVLGRTSVGEANISVWLLTRDYGLVRAHAQRARDITSKLRYGLQLFSLSTVSLVRGRQRWRVVNTIPHRSYASRFLGKQGHMDIAAKVSITLRHLIVGEEVDAELFHILHSTFNWLSGVQTHTLQDIQAVERIAILRILHHLGYIDPDKTTARTIMTTGYSESLIEEMCQQQLKVTRLINDALNASHLVDSQPYIS